MTAWRWGTVTASSPLRVRLDGDSDQLPFAPAKIAGGGGALVTGSRVWCQMEGNQVIIHSAPSPLDVYPVGSIYLAVNPTNPAGLFGGTWQAWGTGRVPIGVDTSQAEFNTVQKTGGAKTHTLTVNEMPNHNHPPGTGGNFVTNMYPNAGNWVFTTGASNMNANGGTTTGNTGGGAAHNNLPPYITCFMWLRTA